MTETTFWILFNSYLNGLEKKKLEKKIKKLNNDW